MLLAENSGGFFLSLMACGQTLQNVENSCVEELTAVDSRILEPFSPLFQVELNDTNLPAVCVQNYLMTELPSLNERVCGVRLSPCF